MVVSSKEGWPWYWITYDNGVTRHFRAANDREADWYFRTEGDHAKAYGRVGKRRKSNAKD